MVLPWASVIVIIVLLKLALTCATPEAMFLRSRRRTRVASLPIHDPFAVVPGMSGAVGQSLRLAFTIFFCRQSPWPDPCGFGHWYGCAGRAREARGDVA